MRTLTLGVLVLVGPAAHAGLYLPIEKDFWHLPSSSREYNFLLQERQGLLTLQLTAEEEKKGAGRYLKEVLQRREELEKKKRDGTLTPEEGITLGGYYILLHGRPRQDTPGGTENLLDPAIELLDHLRAKIGPEHPAYFMVLANLATANLHKGVLERADGWQSDVVGTRTLESGARVPIFPRKYPGVSSERLRWQLRAEQLFLSLIRLRERGGQQPRPASGDIVLDDIFPGAHFARQGAAYAAGQTDAETHDSLPPDAVALVEQLQMWLPQDKPLEWLRAELYNATGRPQEALTILASLTELGISGEGLREHRRILAEALKPEPPPDPPPWQADARSVGIGLGVGALVGILLGLQLVQLFRRRRPAPVMPKTAAVTPAPGATETRDRPGS